MRVFGKGFAKGVKTAVKAAKDVKKVVSEGKTYSQFMKEMNDFKQSASQRGAFSTNFGFKFGKGTGQNKYINLNVGTGNDTSTIASYQKTSTSGGGRRGNEVGDALGRFNQIQHGGDGGWSKQEIAREVAKERRFNKSNIKSTGGPNSISSKIRENALLGYASGGNTNAGSNAMRGGYNHAKSNPRSGNNPVLNFAKNLLFNKKNKAPVAGYLQKNKSRYDMMNDILPGSVQYNHVEHDGESINEGGLATLAGAVKKGLSAGSKVKKVVKVATKSSEVASNVKEPNEASVNEAKGRHPRDQKELDRARNCIWQ